MKHVVLSIVWIFFFFSSFSYAAEKNTALKEYQRLGFSKENSHLVPIEEIPKLADIQGELRENLWSYGEFAFKSVIAPEVIEAIPLRSKFQIIEETPKVHSNRSTKGTKTFVLIVSPKKSLRNLIKKAPATFSIPATTPAKVAAIVQNSEKNFIITLVTVEPPRFSHD